MSEPDSETSGFWKAGDQRLIRFLRLGRISWVFPVTDVDDGPDLTALYLRPGTPTRRRTMPDGSPIPPDLGYSERARLPHVVGHGMWRTNHALVLVRSGDAHDVRLFWSERWEFRGWYVNLQDPIRRTTLGFDSVDHVVDIVVRPDGSWAWKDEDEFADAIAIGRVAPDTAQAIREEGQQVIRDIGARRCPFDDSWLDWRPDPAWPVPSVPLNWDDLAV